MTNFSSVDPSDVSPWPTITRIGLFGGLIMIVVAMISNLTGFSIPTSILQTVAVLGISLVLATGVSIWAVRTHREQELGGYISFGRAFLVGAVALLVASLLNGIFNYIYVTIIDPEYLNMAIQKSTDMMENMGMSASDIEAQLETMEKRMTPAGIVQQTLTSSAILSVIVGLIVAAVMKKNRPVVEDILDK